MVFQKIAMRCLKRVFKEKVWNNCRGLEQKISDEGFDIALKY